MGARSRDRDDGNEREIDDDDAAWTDVAGGRHATCWSAETSACRSARRSRTPRPRRCTSSRSAAFSSRRRRRSGRGSRCGSTFADDHLDRHPTVEAYAAAKARIFANQRAEDWAVVNARRPDGDGAQRRHRAHGACGFSPLAIVERGLSRRRRLDCAVARRHRAERLIPVSAVELTGRHMLDNVVAAAAAASVAGVSTSAMVAALRGFSGLEHVMEPSGRVGGVRSSTTRRRRTSKRRGGRSKAFPAASSRSSAGTSRAATSAICVRRSRREAGRSWRWARRRRLCARRSPICCR